MGALIADAAYFSPVDAHRTAGEGQIPVVIDAGTEELNHAARDDQIRIGLDQSQSFSNFRIEPLVASTSNSYSKPPW